MRRSSRALRRRCASALAELSLPEDGLDLVGLLRRIEVLRGRSVHLAPVSTHHMACGMWLALDGADIVHYSEGTTAWHQQHIICHEMAHMILGHHGAALTESAREHLLPGLDPAMVVNVLRREGYESTQELEAEHLGTLLSRRLEQMHRLPRREELDEDTMRALRELLTAFGELNS
jgi:hypothetical protein